MVRSFIRLSVITDVTTSQPRKLSSLLNFRSVALHPLAFVVLFGNLENRELGRHDPARDTARDNRVFREIRNATSRAQKVLVDG